MRGTGLVKERMQPLIETGITYSCVGFRLAVPDDDEAVALGDHRLARRT